MSHDHFGFYLGWGSVVLLPTLYTIQVQYLARFPVDLTLPQVVAILSLGLGGYALFRSANHQKDVVRSTNGQCNIWGNRARYIRCSYKTEDGRTHESLLLTSGMPFARLALSCQSTGLIISTGWWGFSRHTNYLGDLMQAFSMCAVCGFDNLMPWYYFLFIAAILFHRVLRDEGRCLKKYGKNWELYCSKVSWRLIPGIF